MRLVIQRVTRAVCRVDGQATGEIGAGLLVFVGVGREDDAADVDWLARKVASLRIFEDEEGRMNRSVREAGGGVLAISQFTLYGNLKKGSRPSFNRSADPEPANHWFEAFKARLAEELGVAPASGVFAADMQIEAGHDGPVTLIIDSKMRDF